MPLITLGIIAIAATAGATYYSMQQAKQQANTANKIAENNAQQIEAQGAAQAKQIKTASREKQRLLLDERRRAIARNRAKTGASGVTMEGSPLLNMQETAKNITLDKEMENYNAGIEADAVVTKAKSEAALWRYKGKSAIAAGKLQAGAALFGGASQMADIGMSMKSAQNKGVT